jgi:nitrogen fixation-related uncharacterized protein
MPDERFVSYKSLMVTGLSVIAICVTISIFTWAMLSKSIDKKADAFETVKLCNDIGEIKSEAKESSKHIGDIRVSIKGIETLLQIRENNKKK